VTAHPFISVCFFCIQATIVSRLKCCDFLIATIKQSPVRALEHTAVCFIWAAR
jgi:hypothetical protein